MAKILDKMFNRVIDGNVLSVNEKDKEVLGKALLSDTPKIWEVEEGSQSEQVACENCKKGDIFDLDGDIYYVSNKDTTEISLINFYQEYISIKVLRKTNSVWGLFNDSYYNLSSFLTKSEGARVWNFEDLLYDDADISDYDLSGVKAGDIIYDTGAVMIGLVYSKQQNNFSIVAFNLEGQSPIPIQLISSDYNSWGLYEPLQVGTKLYKHTISFTNDVNHTKLILITTTPSAYNSFNSIPKSLSEVINAYRESDDLGVGQVLRLLESVSLFVSYYDFDNEVVREDEWQDNVAFTDTVTPL